MLRTKLMTLAAVLLAGGPALAGPVNNVTQGTTYDTIQRAINASVDLDVIEVDSGLYFENINYLGKNITIQSVTGDPNDAFLTDSGSGDRGVRFENAESSDAVLRGFSLFSYSTAVSILDSSPTIEDCVFVWNDFAVSSEEDAGTPRPAIRRCSFVSNSLNSTSHAAVALHGGIVAIEECTFVGNQSVSLRLFPNLPGTSIGTNGVFMVSNCQWSGNTHRPVVEAYAPIAVEIVNCTIDDASFGPSGSPTIDLRLLSGGYPFVEISNSIIRKGSTSDLIDVAGSFVTATHCNLEGGIPAGVTDLGGNIDADPLFVDADGADGIQGTPDDDLRLAPGSPCIDAGNNSAASGLTTNLGAGTRRWDDPATPDTGSGTAPIVDMGAYELIGTVSVPSGAATIQAAIDTVNDHPASLIEVGAGTYFENLDCLGKAFTLRPAPGARGTTTLDGGGVGAVIICDSGEGPDTVVEGFTITNGNSGGNGGGMIIDGASPTVTDCVFTLNAAPAASGAGMFIADGAAPTIQDCDFIDNTSINGSGIFVDGSDPDIMGCTFSANTSTGGGALYNFNGSTSEIDGCTLTGNIALGNGGAMLNNQSNPVVTGCAFTGNTTSGNGGGMLNFKSAPIVSDCLFEGNMAPSGSGAGMWNQTCGLPLVHGCTFRGNTAINGAAMFNDPGSAPEITQSLFINNVATGSGGAIFNLSGGTAMATNCTFHANIAGIDGGAFRNVNTGSAATLNNCILWNNTPDEIWNTGGATAAVHYCNVQGGIGSGSSGMGNIDADPLFVDADGADNVAGTSDDDLRLAEQSPCIDAADSTSPAIGTLSEDLDGNPRFADDTGTPDTGVGPAPVVDMGPYEFQGTSPSSCQGDADSDGVVDVNDISYVIFRLGNSGTPGSVDGDTDGNGIVDVIDISYVIFRFGLCL